MRNCPKRRIIEMSKQQWIVVVIKQDMMVIHRFDIKME